MKLEDLLEITPAQWKALSDEELLKFFEPVLNVTRPELAAKVRQQKESTLYSPEQINTFKLKLAKLKALGIDVDEQALMKKMFPRK